MEKSLFDSLFSSESCVFSFKICPPLKIYHLKLYIVKNKGLGWLPYNVEFVSNQNLGFVWIQLILLKTENIVVK